MQAQPLNRKETRNSERRRNKLERHLVAATKATEHRKKLYMLHCERKKQIREYHCHKHDIDILDFIKKLPPCILPDILSFVSQDIRNKLQLSKFATTFNNLKFTEKYIKQLIYSIPDQNLIKMIENGLFEKYKNLFYISISDGETLNEYCVNFNLMYQKKELTYTIREIFIFQYVVERIIVKAIKDGKYTQKLSDIITANHLYNTILYVSKKVANDN